MTRYEQGFLTKCAEYGTPMHVAFNLMKRAVYIGSFDPMAEGVGLSTKSRNSDFNNFFASGTTHPPYGSTKGAIFTDRPSITRIRHSDGSTTYRVTRRLSTPFEDRARRPITHNFSVEVDSPLKAMRLAKGKVRFDKNTQGILDGIASSTTGDILDAAEKARLQKMDGFLDMIRGSTSREGIGRFGLMAGVGTDPGVTEVIRNSEKHRINYVKFLRRLAKLHPGKAKAIAAAVAALGIGGAGATTAAVVHKKKKKR